MAKRKLKSEESPNERETLELEKLRLELETLRHPIKSSLRSFDWKDVVAIVVAFVGVVLLWQARVFDANRQYLAASTERLKIERLHLEEDNEELEKTRFLLTTEQRRLQEELKTTQEQLGVQENEWTAIMQFYRGIENSDIHTTVEIADEGNLFDFTIGPNPWHQAFQTWSTTREFPKPIVDTRVTELIECLRDVRRASRLDIEHVQLDEEDLDAMSTLHITRLALKNNNVTDEMVEPIGRMSQLTHLSLLGNPVRHPNLTGLNSLQNLHLIRTSFDDAGLEAIRPLSDHLLFMFLANTNITDGGIEHLSGFNELLDLGLQGCENITVEGIQQIVDLPKLRFLDLLGRELSDDEIAALKKKGNSELWIQYGKLPPPPAPK